jgi:hypothetical protein
MSVSTLTNRTCVACSPTAEVLHDAFRCVLCGHTPGKKRGKSRDGDAPAWALKRQAHMTAANRPTAKRGN